jgi:hypothetical protein
MLSKQSNAKNSNNSSALKAGFRRFVPTNKPYIDVATKIALETTFINAQTINNTENTIPSKAYQYIQKQLINIQNQYTKEKQIWIQNNKNKA